MPNTTIDTKNILNYTKISFIESIDEYFKCIAIAKNAFEEYFSKAQIQEDILQTVDWKKSFVSSVENEISGFLFVGKENRNTIKNVFKKCDTSNISKECVDFLKNSKGVRLECLVVHPKFQKQGVGSLLINHFKINSEYDFGFGSVSNKLKNKKFHIKNSFCVVENKKNNMFYSIVVCTSNVIKKSK